ncbi:MAG: response regulator transcription factor [Desulfobacteraceae bacterium]|jgi:DNA-binding NarL/FixJ family response regulator
MTPYRIILADDHVMLRDGIKQIINETKGMQVVAEASDGLELLQLVKQHLADMVILDISMPRLRGIEAAQEIRKLYPRIRTLFLSMYKTKEYLHLALSAGAKGYMLKEDTGSELILAIEAIRNGKTYLSPLIEKDLPDDFIGIGRGDGDLQEDPLSCRERQILKLIAEGKTSKEISALLFISIHTVNNHRKNIKNKLKIRKNADLVKYAIQQGYVT